MATTLNGCQLAVPSAVASDPITYAPFLEAKFLELPPSLGDDELTPGLAKGVSPAPAQIGLVLLCIGYPIKYLLREDLLAQLGNLGRDLFQDTGRYEY